MSELNLDFRSMLVKMLRLSWMKKMVFESCLHPKPHLVVIRIFSFLRISNDEPVPLGGLLLSEVGEIR